MGWVFIKVLELPFRVGGSRCLGQSVFWLLSGGLGGDLRVFQNDSTWFEKWVLMIDGNQIGVANTSEICGWRSTVKPSCEAAIGRRDGESEK